MQQCLHYVGVVRLVVPLIVDFGNRRERFKFTAPGKSSYLIAPLIWCGEVFGDSGKKWYWGNGGRFYFKREMYVTMFTLRWTSDRD
jgi:hypothetical protein